MSPKWWVDGKTDDARDKQRKWGKTTGRGGEGANRKGKTHQVSVPGDTLRARSERGATSAGEKRPGEAEITSLGVQNTMRHTLGQQRPFGTACQTSRGHLRGGQKRPVGKPPPGPPDGHGGHTQQATAAGSANSCRSRTVQPARQDGRVLVPNRRRPLRNIHLRGGSRPPKHRLFSAGPLARGRPTQLRGAARCPKRQMRSETIPVVVRLTDRGLRYHVVRRRAEHPRGHLRRNAAHIRVRRPRNQVLYCPLEAFR